MNDGFAFPLPPLLEKVSTRTSIGVHSCTERHNSRQTLDMTLNKTTKLLSFDDFPNDQQVKIKTKTSGDVFLDNIGNLFLMVISFVILAVVRSSKSTTAKMNLRMYLEETSALDPFECDNLRASNSIFDRDVFEKVMAAVFASDNNVLTYGNFVSLVIHASKELRGDGFSVQLGHYLDRVVLSIIEKRYENTNTKWQGISVNNSKNVIKSDIHEMVDVTVKKSKESNPCIGVMNTDDKMDADLLLVILSLAMHCSVRERVEILFEIMLRSQGCDTDHDMSPREVIVHNNTMYGDGKLDLSSSLLLLKKQFVREKDIVRMIGHLQVTSQLVPDSQIVESDTKYPIQEYLVGNPMALVANGKATKKEYLSKGALPRSFEGRKNDVHTEEEIVWTCDDFHHLLRSQSICAWGECYDKKKGLN